MVHSTESRRKGHVLRDRQPELRRCCQRIPLRGIHTGDGPMTWEHKFQTREEPTEAHVIVVDRTEYWVSVAMDMSETVAMEWQGAPVGDVLLRGDTRHWKEVADELVNLNSTNNVRR